MKRQSEWDLRQAIETARRKFQDAVLPALQARRPTVESFIRRTPWGLVFAVAFAFLWLWNRSAHNSALAAVQALEEKYQATEHQLGLMQEQRRQLEEQYATTTGHLRLEQEEKKQLHTRLSAIEQVNAALGDKVAVRWTPKAGQAAGRD